MAPPVSGPAEGLNAAVAAELRAELARQRISVQALSESSGVPYGTLRRYLAAERHIDVAVLAQVSVALDVDPASVIEAASTRVDYVWTSETAEGGGSIVQIAAPIDLDESVGGLRKTPRKTTLGSRSQVSGERDELEAIVEQLPTFEDRLIVRTLVNTGLRWGEYSGHHRHRLDLAGAQLRVVETFDEKGGQIKAYPKGRRVRDLPLLPGLVDDYARLFELEQQAANTCPVPHATGRCRAPLTMTSARGGVLRNSNWSDRVWAPAVEAAGVQHVRIHDLRHTFASWLLQGGRSLAEVGQLLGHVSPLTTQRYAHLARRADPGVLEALAGPDWQAVSPRVQGSDVTPLRYRR